MSQPVLPLGRYRHYKGGEYQVLHLARHSETEEWLVVYQPCYGERGIWVRPYAMFTEILLLEGKRQARFQLISTKDTSMTSV
ncbi:DUF1653 domain-containing protein [Marinospirillum sp. MEB164]|uniref:DUF1653 domain-containing protein n=1 Tax=Marinospirillum alkalitolerans TaxID=3123374 RepID=A0ABW8PWT4_9GAMM